jgi:hypothetical protein
VLAMTGLAIAGMVAAGLLTACGAAAGPGEKDGAGPAATHEPASQQPQERSDSPAAGGAGQPDSRATDGRSGGTLRTSCRSVAHIGDSTSVDLISAVYLPDPATRLAARYRDVGVRHLQVDASSGRSIVEALPGQVNGYNVARAWRAAGYRGCWVIALGTNDVANVANGSAVGLAERIRRMMSVIGNDPVMWVSTMTLATSGSWSSANEQAWNLTLTRALSRYPNMRIFDWAAVAKPAWFLPDGIHYNSVGCAIRARAIATALARAFPANGTGATRVVR